MNTLQSSKIDFYKSLDFIFVWNYYKAEETGDLRYLLKLDDYECLPEYNTDELEDVWDDLRTQANQMAIDKDKESEFRFNKVKLIAEQSNDYEIIQLTIVLLALDKDEKYINQLVKYGYRIDEKKDYYKELERIKKQSQIRRTKISVLENDLKILNKSSNSKLTAWDEIEAVGSYLKQDIDVHKMNMSMYLIKKYRAKSETAKMKK